MRSMSRRANNSLAHSPVSAVMISKSFCNKSDSTLRTCGSSSTIRREHWVGVTCDSHGAHKGHRKAAFEVEGAMSSRFIAHPNTVSKPGRDLGPLGRKANQ